MKKIVLKIGIILMSFMLLSGHGLATEENVVSNETAENTVLQEPVKEEPKEEIPTETKKNETMYVQERCNIRASYSVESDRVGGLDVGTEVTVIAEYSNGWYKIKYGGEEAYIKAGILRSTPPVVEEPEEDLAEEESTPENLPEPTENQEEIDGDYAELINEIGVLPEVGHNIADDLFIGVIILAIGLVIYIKYKV